MGADTSMTKRTEASLETLDFNAALDRVFRGRCPQPGIPPNIGEWRRWVRPSATIPIDDSIAALINRSKDPQRQVKMRPRADIEIDGGADFCPYYATRCVIANAASHATDTLNNRKKASEHAAQLSDLSADAAKLAKSYRAFVSKWKPARMLRDAHFDGATEDVEETGRKADDAFFSIMNLRNAATPVIYSLTRLQEYAQTSRGDFALKGSPTDTWERAFIEQLGYFWCFLTAYTPTRGVDFGAFVTNSYASIGGDKDANFERSIRTVLGNVAARPEYDRFDRDFREPPGKIVWTTGGRRVMQSRPTQEQLNNEVMTYVASALRDGCFESQVRLREILRVAPWYYDLIKDFLPQLRDLPGWTEIPEQS
jgi:hypothetical protein